MSDETEGRHDTDNLQGSLFESAQPMSHEWHRQRLRDRFMKGGAVAMPDYELLEMALFRVFERYYTKDLARILIKKFGSFAEVIKCARATTSGS